MTSLQKGSVEVITFGCRLNTYESEVMKAEAAKAGLDNAILVNTCAVTSEAARQARQAIRRARRENPEARIIVSGCAAQTEAQNFAAMPEVDAVLGNEEKLKAENYRRLPDFGVSAEQKVAVVQGYLLVRSAQQQVAHAVRALRKALVPYSEGPLRLVRLPLAEDPLVQLERQG